MPMQLKKGMRGAQPATTEDIKAYRQKIEKNKITRGSLAWRLNAPHHWM